MSHLVSYDMSNISESEVWFKDLYLSVSDYCGPNYNPLVGSVIGSIVVGLSGIIPVLIIPVDGGQHFGKGAGSERLRLLLSFAVGGLLGDVFLHLLPEAWNKQSPGMRNGYLRSSPVFSGLWVLTGLLVFIIAEKLFQKEKLAEDDPALIPVDMANNNNDPVKLQPKEIGGYLNLMANVIDNFTHGLAVGGSFLLSLRIGLLTTTAIMVHEVPHEVGDFAILLKSGFSRIEAAKAQMITASASLVGALTAYVFSGDAINEKTSWILPFTAGGFLHIALVSVLPELIEETSPWESVKQLASLTGGILVMALLTTVIGV